MIHFQENFSLLDFNTFGVDAKARYFFEFTDLSDLQVFLKSNGSWKEEKYLILGGGSNLLFQNDFDGLIIHPNVPGINSIKEDRQNVWLEVGAGVVWDEFVEYCVVSELGGIENLSLIPGSVGAAPVQNIGAYGREASQFIETVIGLDLETLETKQISAEDCGFGYRDSIFKTKLKNRFVVTSVIFKLEKFPEFEMSYGLVEQEVKKLGGASLRNIRKAIIDIRNSKLPDPEVYGNAGSFFKNPVVDGYIVSNLKAEYADMPVYPADGDKLKLAAGWLIDQCGWKGFRAGDAGVHEKQALVIINHGNATGEELFKLSEKIKASVKEKFGICLEREVNVI